MTRARFFTSITGRPAVASDARHPTQLTRSVGGLVASVAALMCLSLSGCQMFEGTQASSGGSTSPGSKSDLPGSEVGPRAASYKHVATEAPNLTIAGVLAEPEMRVRIASAVTEAIISSAPPGWAPKPLAPVSPAPPVVSTSGVLGSAGTPPTIAGPIGPVIVEAIGGRGGSGMSHGGSGGFRMSGPVRVTYVAGDWLITDSIGTSQRIAAEAIELGPEPVANQSYVSHQVTFAGAAYPGRLRLLPRTDVAITGANAGFDVIEQVPLETYLCGVVVKEMFSNWPLEAFRVQAICARSYALHERVRAMMTGKSYDVEASQRDQAYSGATTNRRALEAVESTRGLVLS
ncbi:MAG: SpoIID/LytB domain-containing protein, partial [Pyrinomonadaceae bacterium]|nr:SpoIID/LytB domain-containing protein [Phycisphaerales bacterium]